MSAPPETGLGERVSLRIFLILPLLTLQIAKQVDFAAHPTSREADR